MSDWTGCTAPLSFFPSVPPLFTPSICAVLLLLALTSSKLNEVYQFWIMREYLFFSIISSFSLMRSSISFKALIRCFSTFTLSALRFFSSSSCSLLSFIAIIKLNKWYRSISSLLQDETSIFQTLSPPWNFLPVMKSSSLRLQSSTKVS